MDEHLLRYKDFLGSLEFSIEDNCLYGRILNVEDLVTYEGRTVEEARLAFEESVEDYLRICAELDNEANMPRQRGAVAPGGQG